VFFTWQRPHADLYRRDPDRDDTSIFEQRMRSVHFRDPNCGASYCIGRPSAARPCWADYYLSDATTRVNVETGIRDPCVWTPGTTRVSAPSSKNEK